MTAVWKQQKDEGEKLINRTFFPSISLSLVPPLHAHLPYLSPVLAPVCVLITAYTNVCSFSKVSVTFSLSPPERQKQLFPINDPKDFYVLYISHVLTYFKLILSTKLWLLEIDIVAKHKIKQNKKLLTCYYCYC